MARVNGRSMSTMNTMLRPEQPDLESDRRSQNKETEANAWREKKMANQIQHSKRKIWRHLSPPSSRSSWSAPGTQRRRRGHCGRRRLRGSTGPRARGGSLKTRWSRAITGEPGHTCNRKRHLGDQKIFHPSIQKIKLIVNSSWFPPEMLSAWAAASGCPRSQGRTYVRKSEREWATNSTI